MKDWTAEQLKKLADDELSSCYSSGSLPRVGGLAQKADMRADTFSKLFHRKVGIRAAEYLKRGQIERGKTLLLATDWSLPKIAEACCIPDPETFSRLFQRIVGMPPGAYRRLRGSSPSRPR